MNLVEKYLGHANQFTKKSDASKYAKKLERETKVKHVAKKTKAYREGGLKEIDVWTVQAIPTTKFKAYGE